jgi:hypothetical protein
LIFGLVQLSYSKLLPRYKEPPPIEPGPTGLGILAVVAEERSTIENAEFAE